MTKSRKTTQLIVIAVLTIALYFGATSLSSSKDAARPVESRASLSAKQAQAIAGLRELATDNPKDISKQRALLLKLQEKINSEPSKDDIIDLIATHDRILRIDPNDTDSLRALATLSYNTRVLDKAALYFERLLALEPKDHDSWITYGSTLSMQGNYHRAQEAFSKVTVDDSNRFLLLANQAINYRRWGKLVEVQDYYARAVSAATEQEQERFKEYFSELEKALIEQTRTQATEKAATTSLRAYLESNPITSKKFDKLELGKDSIRIFMRNFPMEQMPAVAKESFKTKLYEAIKDDPSICKLDFVDVDTGADLSGFDFCSGQS